MAEEEQKDAIYRYSAEGYTHINEALRSGAKISPITKYDVEDITNMISQSAYDFDMQLHRGYELTGDRIDRFFKVPTALLQNGSTEELKNGLKNRKITDSGFFSTSALEHNDFTDKSLVNMHINVPKGSKALYMEPFSDSGRGARRAWDGISEQEKFGNEMEVLLQRNSTFKINDVQREEDGKVHIYMDLLRQRPRRI